MHHTGELGTWSHYQSCCTGLFIPPYSWNYELELYDDLEQKGELSGKEEVVRKF
jgi:hypothetical protein